MAFIEKLSESLVVNWTEDQPSIRPVKNHFVSSGVVAGLVDILKRDDSRPVRQTADLAADLDGVFDRVHVKGQYVCEVSRSLEYPYNDAPAFLVRIGHSDRRQPWDAIGNIYISPFPDWIAQSL